MKELDYIKRCIITLETEPLLSEVMLSAIINQLKDLKFRTDGGYGSGNWGHSSVKGHRGGSAPGSGGNKFRIQSANGFTSAAKERATRKRVIEDYGVCDIQKVPDDSSLSKYVKDGKVSPARERLYRKIIEKFVYGVPKAEGQPTMTFMGGGPAAGKSTVLNDPDTNAPKSETTIMVDSDTIKSMLPEYNMMLADNNPDAAQYVHAESSMLSQRIVEIGQRNGYNVMLDGTGDGTADRMRQYIREARDAGMIVNGIYCTCDTEEAVRRAERRGNDIGRVVPEEYIRETHSNVSKILPEIANEFDSVKLYDTNATGKPILVATADDRKPLTVTNNELYERFINKIAEK